MLIAGLTKRLYRSSVFVFLFLALVVSLSACGQAPALAATQPANNPIDVQEMLQKAEVAFEAGDFEEASKLAQKVIQNSPRRITMPSLGPTELIIILVIVLLLFGVGRIGKIAGELGSGIRAFKAGLQPEEDEKEV